MFEDINDLFLKTIESLQDVEVIIDRPKLLECGVSFYSSPGQRTQISQSQHLMSVGVDVVLTLYTFSKTSPKTNMQIFLKNYI